MNAKEKISAEISELVKDGNKLLKKFQDKKDEPAVHLDYQGWYDVPPPSVAV